VPERAVLRSASELAGRIRALGSIWCIPVPRILPETRILPANRGRGRWLKDAVDLDSVRTDLASVVDRALEPSHVSLWVSGGPG